MGVEILHLLNKSLELELDAVVEEAIIKGYFFESTSQTNSSSASDTDILDDDSDVMDIIIAAQLWESPSDESE